MNGSLVIDGVFVHPLLVAACLAFLLAEVIASLAERAGLYRYFWHRGLADAAMTIILWGLLGLGLNLL